MAALADEVLRRYRALVLVSAGLGLRQGEACGLTVDRLDFRRRKVTVDRQLVTLAGVGMAVLGPVKTASSNRVLPLPSSVRDVLAAHLAEDPAGTRRADLHQFDRCAAAPLDVERRLPHRGPIARHRRVQP